MDSTLKVSANISIGGTCAKGFEPVKEAFKENFVSGEEDCAQLCIYVGNKCVVDLYGSVNGDKTYDADSLHVSNIHSME